MGANSSCISELPSNEYLIRLCSTECISSNDPFWNQLLSFTFQVPRNRFDLVMSYMSCLPILKTSLGLCYWLSCVCHIWATVSYCTPIIFMTSFTFVSPDQRLLEESTTNLCKNLAINNCQTGNFGALVQVFLSRALEIKDSAQCEEY